MKNITFVSTILKWVFIGYIASLPLLAFGFWLLPYLIPLQDTGLGALLAHKGFFLQWSLNTFSPPINLASSDLSLMARVLGFGGALFEGMFKGAAAYFLVGIFSQYQQGVLFSHAHALLFKRIGVALFLYSTIGMVGGTALHSLAATLDNAPGKRMISLSFGTPNVEVIVISTLMILIAWVMLEGFKLKQDYDLTI